jgi:hypothetical protein
LLIESFVRMNLYLADDLRCMYAIRYFCGMSCAHRYRSLLLALRTFVLVLLAGASMAFGMDLHHAPFAPSTVASAQGTMSDHAVVHVAPDHSTDDASPNGSPFGDDGDLDDQLVVPGLAHVAPRSLNCGVLIGNTPSLQSAPSAELLRPPRAA